MAEASAYASPAQGCVRERLSFVLRNGKSARIAKQQRGPYRLADLTVTGRKGQHDLGRRRPLLLLLNHLPSCARSRSFQEDSIWQLMFRHKSTFVGVISRPSCQRATAIAACASALE